MKAKLFAVVMLLFTIIGVSVYYNQMHQKVVDLQKFVNSQQERIAVADVAIQVYRFQEALHELPNRSADIDLPPWLVKEFTIKDADSSGIRSRQSAAFRGTGFNLYCERSATGKVVVSYENTKPVPLGELHGNVMEFKNVRLASSPTAFRINAPIRNKDVKGRSAN